MSEHYLLEQAAADELIQKEFDALLQDYLNLKSPEESWDYHQSIQFCQIASQWGKTSFGRTVHFTSACCGAHRHRRNRSWFYFHLCRITSMMWLKTQNNRWRYWKSFWSQNSSGIVEGLTKISGGVFGEKASGQAENFRKLLLTMSEDIRLFW